METTYFSDLVSKAIQTAGKLATRGGCDYVISEHILLSTIDECLRYPVEGNVVLKTFKRLNIDLFELITDFEKTFEKKNIPVANNPIPIEKRAEIMLKLSFYETKMRGGAFISPEDVLLSYLKAGGLFCESVLTPKYALTYQRVKNELNNL